MITVRNEITECWEAAQKNDEPLCLESEALGIPQSQLGDVSPLILIAEGSYIAFPLCYRELEDDGMTFVPARGMAVWSLLDFWTMRGKNTRHVKTPYGSKTFDRYLEQLGYLSADFLVLPYSPQLEYGLLGRFSGHAASIERI